MQNATSRVWGEGSFSLVCVSLLHFIFFSCKNIIIFSLLSSNIYWKSQKNAIYMTQIVWVRIVLVTICFKSVCWTTSQWTAKWLLPTLIPVRFLGGWPFRDSHSQASASNVSSPHLEEVALANTMHLWCRQHISPGPSPQHLPLI